MDAATYERPPENLDPAARELIRGVYKLKDRLLLVLDAETNGGSSRREGSLARAMVLRSEEHGTETK